MQSPQFPDSKPLPDNAPPEFSYRRELDTLVGNGMDWDSASERVQLGYWLDQLRTTGVAEPNLPADSVFYEIHNTQVGLDVDSYLPAVNPVSFREQVWQLTDTGFQYDTALELVQYSHTLNRTCGVVDDEGIPILNWLVTAANEVGSSFRLDDYILGTEYSAEVQILRRDVLDELRGQLRIPHLERQVGDIAAQRDRYTTQGYGTGGQERLSKMDALLSEKQTELMANYHALQAAFEPRLQAQLSHLDTRYGVLPSAECVERTERAGLHRTLHTIGTAVRQYAPAVLALAAGLACQAIVPDITLAADDYVANFRSILDSTYVENPENAFQLSVGDALTGEPLPGTRVSLLDSQERLLAQSITNDTGTVSFLLLPRYDVNADGSVDILDLVRVGASLGATGSNLAVDVNADGTVDILDLVLVGSHFGESYALSAPALDTVATLDTKTLQQWLEMASAVHDGTSEYQRGLDGLANLFRQQQNASPTRLYQNYPNPFNPETWIPFSLTQSSDVSISIYATTGEVVRELDLGYRDAGTHLNRDRAAFWDGRNNIGEQVANGVYFYVLESSHGHDTGKMVLLSSAGSHRPTSASSSPAFQLSTDHQSVVPMLTAPALESSIPSASYLVSVSDDGPIYCDIRGNLGVRIGETLNVNLIPHLDPEHPGMGHDYTSWLEFVLRNTGNEPRTVLDRQAVLGDVGTRNRTWGETLDIYVDSVDWWETDEVVRELVEEFNASYGSDYLVEVSEPTSQGWNVDYSHVDWQLTREITRDVTFDADGNPESCTFYLEGVFVHPNDLKQRLRQQFAECLLLYEDFDPRLLATDEYDEMYFELTRFSPDFINLLRTVNALGNGWDYDYNQHETNRSPVANAGSDLESVVDRRVTLDGSASFDPDSDDVSYRWRQVFGTKTGREYRSSTAVELTNPESARTHFTPPWPGIYAFELEVIDAHGAHNVDLVDVEVHWDSNPIGIRGVSLGAYYDHNFMQYDQLFDRFESWNVDSICINPEWWMPDRDSNEIMPLHSSQDLPKGLTMPDDRLRYIIDLAHERGFSVCLKPMIETFYWATPRSDLQPPDMELWFQSYRQFINHYAEIAEEMDVELLSIGTELLPMETFTDEWKRVIQDCRAIYSGALTYSAATTYIENYSDIIEFWSDLDYIGIAYYPSGSGRREWGSGEEDPSVDDMVLSLAANFTTTVLPVLERYRIPIILTESGCINVDGANQLPWAWYWPETPGIDNNEQQEYYEAILRFALRHPVFAGVYWWESTPKYDYTRQLDDIPFSFQPEGQPIEDVIRTWFR